MRFVKVIFLTSLRFSFCGSAGLFWKRDHNLPIMHNTPTLYMLLDNWLTISDCSLYNNFSEPPLWVKFTCPYLHHLLYSAFIYWIVHLPLYSPLLPCNIFWPDILLIPFCFCSLILSIVLCVSACLKVVVPMNSVLFWWWVIDLKC